jgi:photosystem I subunit 3
LLIKTKIILMSNIHLTWFLILNFFGTPQIASADVSGLVLCKESPVFERRINVSLQKLNARLVNYKENTPAYLALKEQINRTKGRFVKYGEQGLLCGVDGLPHLIADGRLNHAGEFLAPGFLFLYIAGYIGWAGRSYLKYTRMIEKPNEGEIIINVPVAIGMISATFLWPFLAWNELILGELFASSEDVTVSPR